MKYIYSFFRAIGSHVWEIIFSVLLVTLLGFIFIPNISGVSENGRAAECREQMHLISEEFEELLNNADFNWSEVLNQKRSQKILDTIKELSQNSDMKQMDTSDYYFDIKKSSVILMCKAHEENDPIEISIPKKYYTNMESDGVNAKLTGVITVSGVRTYIKGEALDADNPQKTVFSPSDDLKKLFPYIVVKIKYIDGETKTLSRDSYELSTDGFDMSKPGTKTITVSYKGENNINTDIRGFFSFKVMNKSEAPAFTVDFGEKGKYTLAAWDWSDYVKDAMAAEGSSLDFGASIVYYKGDYLYYPDGFIIEKTSDNTSPESAKDKDKTERSAYCIKFNAKSIIKSDTQEPKLGSMKLENEEVYIWQEKASKEVDAGWLRVYCDLEKEKSE